MKIFTLCAITECNLKNTWVVTVICEICENWLRDFCFAIADDKFLKAYKFISLKTFYNIFFKMINSSALDYSDCSQFKTDEDLLIFLCILMLVAF